MHAGYILSSFVSSEGLTSLCATQRLSSLFRTSLTYIPSKGMDVVGGELRGWSVIDGFCVGGAVHGADLFSHFCSLESFIFTPDPVSPVHFQHISLSLALRYRAFFNISVS